MRVTSELYFSAAAYEEARERLRAALAEAPAGRHCRQLRDALGVSRKYAIPLLESFDAQGFTKRVGDLRTLRALARYPASGVRLGGRRDPRQGDAEARAGRLDVDRVHGPAVQVHEALRDGESETRAAAVARARPLCAVEPVEDAVEIGLGDARARRR